MKDSFILHHDTLSVIEELTDEQAGQLIKEILAYSLYLNNPNKAKKPTGLSGLMRAVFHSFEMQLNRDFESYKAVALKNSENGKKGGRPTKSQNPNKPKKADNDKDKDKDNDKEKDNVKEKGKEEEKEFSFTLSRETQFENLSNEYKNKLKDEIDKLNLNLSYDDFVEGLMIKSYKYKNFLLAYKKWAKNSFKKTTSKDDDYTLDDLRKFGYKG